MSGIDVKRSSRMEQIKAMYGFSGFVYALDNCPSVNALTSDFTKMKAAGARTVITFDECNKDGYYGGAVFNLSLFLKLDQHIFKIDVIKAAGSARMSIIPLVWTLCNPGQTWQSTVVPKIKQITQAVIGNPGPVLAVAMGDEPLFDHDAGDPSTLAKAIMQMKSDFKNAGIPDIPVSISDMAYGWQSGGDVSSVVTAVDFFMINNFPYFGSKAESGGSDSTWKSFTSDITYFQKMANGKPLLVTQTGWPSAKGEWSSNSKNVVVSVESSQGFWALLDSHCEDFFKKNNIGWMWRSWDDTISGWGVLKSDGTKKWDFSAKQTC
ncbi:glycoside hydrolase [Rickenella mellea]|uniref:glucan endo-1,3-beta-D-glucosidase n=1 Tax=Rickenella mellea TaxID=50990 RepID=A0A4Y7QJG5_9AGAM|nr:glycoside hydrolase [Rickenella mellea]